MNQIVSPVSSADTTSGAIQRRTFLSTISKAAGAAALLSTPLAGMALNRSTTAASITVGDVMDLFIRQIPGAPFANTVDTLKAGHRDIVVTGILTTMFATVDVIRKAIETGANFIIAHEPAFYNHADETTWLESDDVYQYKANLLKEHNMAVWRNHDYVHSLAADGVWEGVLAQLGWKQYDNGKRQVLDLPTQNLKDIITHCKMKLGIKTVRYIGNLSQSCQKVLLMPGAAGGKRQIEAMSATKPDVLICGEIQEWETAEYVRDARAKGDNLSLVVLGHIVSEEPGSEFMAEWLQKNLPQVKTVHIPAQASLSFA